jgi:kinesin family member 2/24
LLIRRLIRFETMTTEVRITSENERTPQKGLASRRNKKSSTPKKEMTWKELQANHLASTSFAEKRKKSHRKGSSALSDASSVLRPTNRTNITNPEIHDAENDPTTPRTALTTPSPVARRDFLAKKAHLLGNRGSAYAFSPSTQHPSKPMFSPDANTVPRAHSAIKAEPSVVKQNPAPFKPIVANTSSTKSVVSYIRPTKQREGHVQEIKKLTEEEEEAKRKAVTVAVAKKYTWETKPKQEAPKPNKTASKAMSFRSAKLKYNGRSVAKLVDMISPKASQNSTVEPPLALDPSAEPKMPNTQVPSFGKNPLETVGKDMASALGKLQLKASSNEARTVIPLPKSPRSPTPVKTTQHRWSMKDTKSPYRIPNNPGTPLEVERERDQRIIDQVGDCGNTRRNLDKRSARLHHGDDFKASIAAYRIQQASPRPNHTLAANLHLRGGFGKNGVSTFVRKRPIFDYELDRGDFDVLFTEAKEDHDSVVVHVCQMHADMQQQLVKTVSFPCSAAFDESCSNEELYQNIARPLVNLAIEGGLATILMYGQTGSGKSFTMTGIEERICVELFTNLATGAKVSVQFVELKGKHCSDLLEDGPVKIVDQADGSVRLLNAATVHAATPAELSQIIAGGKRRRSTKATDRNGVSSRSHAVCHMSIGNHGMLTLIDLAGSERKNDSLYHTRDRQKESSEINASLWALKECIRSRASGNDTSAVHVPYRSSVLTRILREPLEREGAQLCVIATVAPNATDTEHTLETLKTLANFVGADSNSEETAVVTLPRNAVNNMIAPKQWDYKQVCSFLKKKNCIDEDFVVPERIDGRVLMRMNTIQIKITFFDGKRDADERAVKLFRCIRAETGRVSEIQLKRRMSAPSSQSPFKL